MYFEKNGHGFLREPFGSEGEGAKGCKRGGKGRVSELRLTMKALYIRFSLILRIALKQQYVDLRLRIQGI